MFDVSNGNTVVVFCDTASIANFNLFTISEN
jgi:hypothetical protein